MKSVPYTPDPNSPDRQASPGFEAKLLRLVKGAHERRAIKSGQVDAILDRVSGSVILMPGAQAALLKQKALCRSLVALCADGTWEQDEHYRFVAHTGTAIGNEPAGDSGILGKTLWELPFVNGDELDWQTHRSQLEWRVLFRDLELGCVDRAGKHRTISISGEPMFDSQGQFSGYRGIVRDLTARKPAHSTTPDSEPFARSALDALAAPVCLLDAAGTIVATNAAWRAFAASRCGGARGVSEGGNYFTASGRSTGNEDANIAAMVAGIREVMAGERELFRYKRVYATSSGKLEFMASATGVHTVKGKRVIVSYEDITEAKRTEQLLWLECTVARRLAETTNMSEALKGVIRAICETLRWDCGRYFRVDPAGVLSLAESWGVPAPAVQRLLDRSRGVVFRPGAGLASRVCQSGQPIWILSGSTDTCVLPGTPTHETGADGAFVFPVTADDKTVGVLAFESRTVHEPDDRLLQTVRRIGQSLGQFLLRQQAMDVRRQSENRYRRLLELSCDWIWEQDRDFRFTEVAGGGMHGSGHVVGQHLWDPSANVVLDDDAWMRHKLQLAEHWSFCDFEYAVLQDDGRLNYFYISGEPVYDGAGVFIGYHGTGVDITERKRAETAPSDANLPSS